MNDSRAQKPYTFAITHGLIHSFVLSDYNLKLIDSLKIKLKKYKNNRVIMA